MEKLHDVVITGTGVLCTTGRGSDALWQRLLSGVPALLPLPPELDDPAFRCRVAGTVPRSAFEGACAGAGVRGRDDRSVKLALVAAHDALEAAGLLGNGSAASCAACGTIIGTGAGALSPAFEAYAGYMARGVRSVRPTAIPRTMPSTAACAVSIRFGLRGCCRTVASACASGTMAIGEAFRLVRHGYLPRVLCGGTDALIERTLYAAWSNMGILAPDSQPDDRGCRPFDAHSGGMVLGEGAAMLVLESAESAARRGAPVLGRVVGYGESADATHLTNPDAAGQGVALAAALARAQASSAQIGAVQAHGTGTDPSDRAEALSLAACLGDRSATVPVVSTKPFTGHTLGASGAIESVIALSWLAYRCVTPNVSLDTLRTGCRLHVPSAPEPLAAPYVLNCAFGFGGANAALLLAAGDVVAAPPPTL